MFRTRFAPSPTGPLHLGHAYSAILAHDKARAEGGDFLLRIDDLDQSRARAHWEDQIYDDLTWLGVTWDGPVRKQSDHFQDYSIVLKGLRERALTFECRCSRRDIEDAASAPQEGLPEFGPDGRIYPGTCRDRALTTDASNCTRLNMSLACARVLPASFHETGPNHFGSQKLDRLHLEKSVGDVVLSRHKMAASYHLSVVIDDAASEISHVIRGNDLFEATCVHTLLQSLLGLPVPVYHHHRLIRDDKGRRLAKRDDARAIRKYREDGLSPQDIRRMIGL